MLTEPNRDGHVSKNFKVTGGHTKEGRLVVVLEWPEEQDGRVFDRDEAVIVGLEMLEVASHLFSNPQEFAELVNYVRTKVLNLQPVVFQPRSADAAEERPVL